MDESLAPVITEEEGRRTYPEKRWADTSLVRPGKETIF
jgi:hypothetical protein